MALVRAARLQPELVGRVPHAALAISLASQVQKVEKQMAGEFPETQPEAGATHGSPNTLLSPRSS